MCQEGEAWNRPFVSVYEPSSLQETKSIQQEEYFDLDNKDFIGIKVLSSNGFKESVGGI